MPRLNEGGRPILVLTVLRGVTVKREKAHAQSAWCIVAECTASDTVKILLGCPM